jgi:hypothetical protein
MSIHDTQHICCINHAKLQAVLLFVMRLCTALRMLCPKKMFAAFVDPAEAAVNTKRKLW